MLPPLEPTPLEVVTPKHPAFEFVVPESITIELMVAIEVRRYQSGSVS